jgi:hypothetical protein
MAGSTSGAKARASGGLIAALEALRRPKSRATIFHGFVCCQMPLREPAKDAGLNDKAVRRQSKKS